MKSVIKVAMWIVALVGAWEVGLTPAVSNAFLQFYAAGVVPGTKVILSPNEMFIVLAVMLAVCAAAIFHTELAKLVRRLARSDESNEQSAPAAEQTIIVTVPRPRGRISMMARCLLRPLRMWSMTALYYALLWFTVAVTLIAVAAVQCWQWAEPYLRQFDHYLDRRLHQNETTATLLSAGAPAVKLVRGWLAAARSAFDRVSSL